MVGPELVSTVGPTEVDKPIRKVQNQSKGGTTVAVVKSMDLVEAVREQLASTRPGRWCTGPPDAVAVAGCGGAGFGGPPLGTATA